MSDLAAAMIDRITIFFGVPLWIIVLSIILIIAIFVGVGRAFRTGIDSSRVDHNKDPDTLQDLSPRLREARLQMLGAAIAMIFVGIIAVMSLFE